MKVPWTPKFDLGELSAANVTVLAVLSTPESTNFAGRYRRAGCGTGDAAGFDHRSSRSAGSSGRFFGAVYNDCYRLGGAVCGHYRKSIGHRMAGVDCTRAGGLNVVYRRENQGYKRAEPAVSRQ